MRREQNISEIVLFFWAYNIKKTKLKKIRRPNQNSDDHDIKPNRKKNKIGLKRVFYEKKQQQQQYQPYRITTTERKSSAEWQNKKIDHFHWEKKRFEWNKTAHGAEHSDIKKTQQQLQQRYIECTGYSIPT